MTTDDFYTDEPIDWQLPENTEGTDSVHSWDYFAPDEDDKAVGWQQPRDYDGSGNVPVQLRQLLDMIRRQPWQITMSKAFYEEARMMAGYVDDADVVPFFEYFPTYQKMTVEQLRSYFTIRRQWRQGKYPDVSLSYVFVYVYELLMLVGVNSAEESYELLKELGEAYAQSLPRLNYYLQPWIRDFVVYHNLSGHFEEVFAKERQTDAKAILIAGYARLDDKTLFETLCGMSRYDIRNSLLFKKEPQKAFDCVVAVLRAIIPKLEALRHHRFETLCFGQCHKRQVTLFANAVFYDPQPVRSAEIQVAPRHRYICRGGLWSKDDYHDISSIVGRHLAAIFHETDCQLREALNIKQRVKSKPTADPYREMIREAIGAWLLQEREAEAAREAERRRVSIDFSKLAKIRSDAEVVMEKLESDTDAEAQAEAVHSSAVNAIDDAVKVPATDEKNLDEQARFLSLLLSSGDYRSYLRRIHVPEGVMVEKVNEMMMDIVGDVVIEDDGSGLHIIDDYRQDIEDYIKEHSA